MRNIDEEASRKQASSARDAERARNILQQIFWAAIKATEPPRLLKRHLSVSGSELRVKTGKGLHRFPLTGKVYVIGAGKGVDLTGPVWGDILKDRLAQGLLVVRDRLFKGRLDRISILEGGHPLPDETSRLAAQRCLELLRVAGRNEWVIFFLMGGASSLLALPASGLTLADKRAVADNLLKSGMDIAAINCVRKHLSAIKAGGIIRAAYPARVMTLAVSDVVENDPTVISSAPTFYDPTTYRDAWNVLGRYRLLKKIPERVRSHLLRGIRGEIPETLKPGTALTRRNPFSLLANNSDALVAARKQAESLGFHATILSAELTGDTRKRARELCSFLKRMAPRNEYPRPHCFLLGGETTVRVQGSGVGGRNQEFALAAALGLAGHAGLYLLSAGSDGSDGPTDAAGAFADDTTVQRGRTSGLDPFQALRDNDSYGFFNRLGDLFRPGPTGTNVSDFKIALMY